MTIEEALASIRPLQAKFEAAFKQKIDSIKFAYSKEISDKQLTFLKRDEDLCKVTEEYVNGLNRQIEFLLKENYEQQLMMGQLASNAEQSNEEYVNICLEFNRLKFDQMRTTGTLPVNLQTNTRYAS